MYKGGNGGPGQAFQKQSTQAVSQELLATKQPDQRARGAVVQDRYRDSPAPWPCNGSVKLNLGPGEMPVGSRSGASVSLSTT